MKKNTNVIAVMFPGFAGGKTIINSLGLSNNCYLQDYKLVQQQKRGELPPEEKVKLLVNRLQSETTKWTDLHLGEHVLFNGSFNSFQFRHLLAGKNYFFICIHNLKTLEALEQVVPNYICISVMNTNKFINFRLGFDDLDFDRTQHPDISQQWPTNIEEYFKSKADILWDCDNFLSKDKFISNIKTIYEILELTDFNEQLVSTYYDKYMMTLRRIIHERKQF